MGIYSRYHNYLYDKKIKNKLKGIKKIGVGLKTFGLPELINPSGISIGDNVNINDRVILNATDSEIIIGNNVTISSNAMILAASYDVKRFLSGGADNKKHKYGRITIGNNVWICAGAIILSNVTITDHVVVAAGSVVIKDINEAWCIVAGNPAKVVKRIEHAQDIASEQ